MSITIKELADELKVSPSTVSKALNNRQGVNNSLRTVIKRTAKRKGYAPYVVSRETGMYDTKLKTIAVIYPRLGQHLIERLQKGTDKVFYKNGYCELRYIVDVGNLLVDEDVENELIFKRLLSDSSISGVLFVFIYIPDNLLAKFYHKGIPAVLLDNYTDYGKCVVINNYQAMFQLVTKLINMGHRKIGLIIPSETSEQIWRERFRAYKESLRAHHIDYDANLVVHEWTFKLAESGFVTKQLINSQPGITALIYGSDIQAYGGLKALRDMKKKVPEDIAVVGFDDMDFNQVIMPSLSSVNQPIEKMGEIGSKMLINAIQNKDFSHEAVKLEANLQLRGSCIKDYQDPFWG